MATKYIGSAELKEQLGLTRDAAIYHLRRGNIRSTRVGPNWMIPASELERIPTTDWYRAIVEKRETAA